jgi:hypothetical protein
MIRCYVILRKAGDGSLDYSLPIRISSHLSLSACLCPVAPVLRKMYVLVLNNKPTNSVILKQAETVLHVFDDRRLVEGELSCWEPND